MLAPIEVSAPPVVKLCPSCKTRPCKTRNADYCDQCAAARNREYRAARRQAVMSGAQKWQCRKCGTTDLALFVDYSADCKFCHNLRNRIADREKSAGQVLPHSEARHLDPQAAALVSIPAEWERTQAKIDGLCNERLRLWLAGAWAPMSRDDRERCEDIAAALPGLWDALRRELAASHFHEQRRPRTEDGWSQRHDLRIG